MVMRSVMEEKMNRIIEVILSSVKPIQLMMGKIIGVGFVEPDSTNDLVDFYAFDRNHYRHFIQFATQAPGSFLYGSQYPESDGTSCRPGSIQYII